MVVAFILSMPGNNSWDGKWSGDGKCYCIMKSFTSQRYITAKILPLLEAGSFGYNFGDGWYAHVDVRAVDAAESRKLRKASKGFCGYDWMVESILDHGKILNSIQQKKLLKDRQMAAV